MVYVYHPLSCTSDNGIADLIEPVTDASVSCVELLSIRSASLPCNTSRHILRTRNLALLGNYSSGRERKRCCAGYEDQNYNILGYIVEKV